MAFKPTIAVSIGDPNGIGPEVLLKSLADPVVRDQCHLVVVGPRAVLSFYEAQLGLRAEFDQIECESPAGFRVLPGQINADSGRISMEWVALAVDLCSAGKADAMVTCPISKEAISLAGYHFPGHTEFIADRIDASDFLMMMVSDGLRVGLVTGHIPISAVSTAVTGEKIERTIGIMNRSLRRDFGIQEPKIAVLGLNPHAGDGGVLGTEDRDVILPAVIRARESGIHIVGPLPADGFFGSNTWKSADGVVAMYHDQGLIPFKALSFGSGVNFTAGLSIVRTSPDHGTAFDIAGTGVANPSSLKKAIEYAVQIVQKRQILD